MIHMVGPSDNEYIYVDFSEIAYDPKWEFPRENLEFGEQFAVLNIKISSKKLRIVSSNWTARILFSVFLAGQVLGSGAFGKVVNAAAYGINETGVSVQVAVKMLKGSLYCKEDVICFCCKDYYIVI